MGEVYVKHSPVYNDPGYAKHWIRLFQSKNEFMNEYYGTNFSKAISYFHQNSKYTNSKRYFNHCFLCISKPYLWVSNIHLFSSFTSVCLFVWFNLAQLLLFSCFFCHSSTKQQIQKLDLIQLWRMNGLGIKCHVIVIRSTVSQWDSLSLVGRDESW